MAQNIVEIALRLGASKFRSEARQARAAFRSAVAGMRQDGNRLKDAFAVLDVRPVREVNREIDRLRAAYNRLARDARVSTRDLARAQVAMKRRIRELRGEIRGTVGAFAALRKALPFAGTAGGAVAIGGGIRSVVQAGIEIERVMNALRFGTGSFQKAKDAFAFVSREAERMGLDVRQAAKDYAQLTAATRGTVLEGEQTKKIFTSIAEASTVLGLSTEDASGALRAIIQIASKGTVQAEELRGQLGERIPGAFQLAARAMGVTEAALNGMLDRGEVLASDFLPRFAEQLHKELGGNVSEAAKSAQAEIKRFNNALLNLNLTISSGGVLSGVTSLVKLLTKLAELEGQNVKGFQLLFSGPPSTSIRIDQEIEKIDERLKTLREEIARPEILRFRTGFAIDPALQDEIDRLEQRRQRLLNAQQQLLFGAGAQEKQRADKTTEINNKIRDAEQRLSQERKDLAELTAKREIALRKQVLRETIRTSEAAIQTKQREVDRLLTEVQRWGERRKQILNEIEDLEADTESRIHDLRRRDMDEAQQQADIEAEAADKIRAARTALAEGRTQDAGRLLGRIDSLASQLDNTDKAVAVLQEVLRIRKELKQAELAAGDKQSEASFKRAAQLQQEIGRARGLIEKLAASLKALEDVDPTIKVRDNIDQVRKRLAQLKAELASLGGKDASVTARAGFATGGHLPGYGGGDRIPAVLEAGEFVIRKEAVRKYGLQLFTALNDLRLSGFNFGGLADLRLRNMPPLQHFATGGPVSPPQGASGETITLRLESPRGGYSLFGERDQVRGFIDALSEMARGG